MVMVSHMWIIFRKLTTIWLDSSVCQQSSAVWNIVLTFLHIHVSLSDKLQYLEALLSQCAVCCRLAVKAALIDWWSRLHHLCQKFRMSLKWWSSRLSGLSLVHVTDFYSHLSDRWPAMCCCADSGGHVILTIIDWWPNDTVIEGQGHFIKMSRFSCNITFLQDVIVWHFKYAIVHYGNTFCSDRNHTHAHTHTRLTAHCPGLPTWASTRKVKPIWSKRQWVAVASAGPYASLYLAPDR